MLMKYYTSVKPYVLGFRPPTHLKRVLQLKSRIHRIFGLNITSPVKMSPMSLCMTQRGLDGLSVATAKKQSIMLKQK